MSGSEEQLISFFAYSFFIYPVTNYLVSPHREYNKKSQWKGVVYAILFLATLSTLHMFYELSEKGPNHYQLLNVTRGTPAGVLKKAFRNLSLELHPDKNKSPTAQEEFRKVKQAYDVLADNELRRAYDLLGDAGVKTASQSVIDHKYIIVQMLVYYASTLIFAFLMTFSESTGDAMGMSIFGLTVMLLIEMLLLLEGYKIPVKLLPTNTTHDVISWLHKLFPAYMNGCRCIAGAFATDRKSLRVEGLKILLEQSKIICQKAGDISQHVSFLFHAKDGNKAQYIGEDGGNGGVGVGVGGGGRGKGKGVVGNVLHAISCKTSPLHAEKIEKAMTEKKDMINNPKRMNQSSSQQHVWSLGAYLIAKYIFSYKSK